ncbi:MAG: mechanosensitive ion channel domain-containing protein [Blastocatellia bacterium]
MIKLLVFILIIWFDKLGTSVIIIKKFSLEKFLASILIIGIAYILMQIIENFIESLSQYAPQARFSFKIFATIIRFIFSFASIIFLVAVFSPFEELLHIVLALMAWLWALSMQQLTKDFIGTIVILIDRPYQLGDRVKIGDAYGEIDHIGLRSTKLTTPDDTRVTIPNSSILINTTWNANSGKSDCLVVTSLYLPHNVKPEEVIELGHEIVCSSPFVLLKKPISVRLKDNYMDGAFMILRIKGYVFDHRFEPKFQSDIILRAKIEFLKRGIVIE